ncbi:hypothetical protein FOZ63_007631 [Perkinsus olseni]|uniref:Uncharacterized protein n=1 Tax=Perkinsus olseni TaxID=32597 RepID=A0A7J6P203_PEROL|nr:hypothetical protein FOZ63_007631 [Perkinsus olseni]KAF4744001.1 hypothetical protein FOZ62_021593 [Perkinsus olseni]
MPRLHVSFDSVFEVPADLAISRVLITCPKGFRHLITTNSALSTQIQLEGFVPVNGSYVALTQDDHAFALSIDRDLPMSSGSGVECSSSYTLPFQMGSVRAMRTPPLSPPSSSPASMSRSAREQR